MTFKLLLHRALVYLGIFLALGAAAWNRQNNHTEVASAMDGIAVKLEKKAEELKAQGNTAAAQTVSTAAAAVSETATEAKAEAAQ